VVEQFRKIAREQFRRESFSAPTGFSVSAAIDGQNRGLTGQSRRNTVPDAAIGAPRMDQYDRGASEFRAARNRNAMAQRQTF